MLEVAIALSFTSTPADAETKRVRVPVSSLPRQNDALEIEPKSAVLPDGAREGSPAPKSWRRAPGETLGDGAGHCTDGRRASVGSAGDDDLVDTQKVWEANGKIFFDRANVKIQDGKVHVVSASRVAIAYVTESAWAYRKAEDVIIVTARDFGVFSRVVLFGCLLEERTLRLPTAASTISSSPEEVDGVLDQLLGRGEVAKNTGRAPWKGVAFTMLASVSKASADPEPMLNLVITQP